MALGLTTELSAINLALRSIGESPASSLASLPDDGISARQVLTDVCRRVLTEGWHFNSDVEYPMVASGTSPYEIRVPATAVSVDLTRYTTQNQCLDLTQRGSRLYDRENHTYSFQGKTVYADIVWLFEFEELPESLRQYIALKSAREFYQNTLQQASTVEGFTAEAEAMARAFWEGEDNRSADKNLIWSNPQLRILRRNAR